MGKRKRTTASTPRRPGTFIDVFAGCGGLSLGLMLAGWRGLFAVEKDRFAFETLKCNLVNGNRGLRYEWPEWLPTQPCEVSGLIEKYREELTALRGRVDLIAGGPPCQGFSLAGRRDANDPRNELFKHYIELVSLIQPTVLLLENVRGIEVEHGKKQRSRAKQDAENNSTDRGDTGEEPFSAVIKRALEEAGYHVYTIRVRAADFGVPQWRPRLLMVGVLKNLLPVAGEPDLRVLLEANRIAFLEEKNLPIDGEVTVWEAISDLETYGKQLEDCPDSPHAKQVKYQGPCTHYQQLLREGMGSEAPNSLRLPMHRDETRHRFWWIHKSCRHGTQLSEEDRQSFGINKKCVVPLSGASASHTLTTLPDDLLHYCEPRNLSVRENARLQSFPDWYEFKGAYCTGGKRRVQECPRYTQVGNAVPPFLGQILGYALDDLCRYLHQAPGRNVSRGDLSRAAVPQGKAARKVKQPMRDRVPAIARRQREPLTESGGRVCC
jgi:DNA (cytosine-5)-methyltransferase 1